MLIDNGEKKEGRQEVAKTHDWQGHYIITGQKKKVNTNQYTYTPGTFRSKKKRQTPLKYPLEM